MANMVLLLQGADAILGDGYGIQGQSYVALIQGNVSRVSLQGFDVR